LVFFFEVRILNKNEKYEKACLVDFIRGFYDFNSRARRAWGGGRKAGRCGI
jgi:hypothetical protein